MRSICLLILITFTACAFAQSPVISPVSDDRVWTKERVREVLERAKSDPYTLWELQNAPLELTYKPLKDLWGSGQVSMETREHNRRRRSEAEWLETEKRVNRDPDAEAFVFPIARDVLLSNSDFESYLRGKLEFITEALLDHRKFPRTNDPRYAKTNDSDLYRYLNHASRIPGDMAFRLIGPCLFGAYYPVEDHGDYKRYSPATNARNRLAALARERLGETVPEDIEAARQWWKANEQRFAAKPSASPATPATGSPPVSVPPATPAPSLATPSAPPIPPTSSASQPTSRRWS